MRRTGQETPLFEGPQYVAPVPRAEMRHFLGRGPLSRRCWQLIVEGGLRLQVRNEAS